MTTRFEWKGSIVLLGMFQHRLHAGRVMRGLERLNSKQREWGIKPYPLAFRNRVISFVLQCTVLPHGNNPTFVVPLNVHAVGIIGDVDRVNRVINCNRDLDFRTFTRIGGSNKAFLMNGLIYGGHGVTNVRRATAVTVCLTPGMSPSVRRAGHRMSDVGQHVVQLADIDA